MSTDYPCRISATERVVHCASCEQVPALLSRIDKLSTDPLSVLTPDERGQIEHYQGYNVPAKWFVGPRENDAIEVVAIGDDFVWSFLLSDGQCFTSEAQLGEFSAGLVI